MLIFLMLMVVLQPGVAQLQVEKIETSAGFTIIQEDKILLPANYNYSLHIIDLKQFSSIITELKITASLLSGNNKDVNTEIYQLEDKLNTLNNGNHNIHKRGLLNIIGTVNKWVSGSMDDEDRQTINKHLEIIHGNSHNLISSINQQVEINNKYNTSLNTLVNTIQNDRKNILNILSTHNDHINLKLNTFDLRLRILETSRILSELQDNIIFTKVNIIHPSLLTHAEIIKYKIDAEKLKGIQVGFAKTNNNKLIFLLKIPNIMTLVNKQIVLPLRNTQSCEMIDTIPVQILKINDTYYDYDINKSIFMLNRAKHCIFSKDCKYIKDCNTEIYNIDDGNMIIQLANKLILSSESDERIYTLYGNYFIKYVNTTIHLGNITYSNKIQETHNKYIIPHMNVMENSTLSFGEIVLKHTENLRKIRELKFYNKISYQYMAPTLIITIIITTIILYFYFKQRRIVIVN